MASNCPRTELKMTSNLPHVQILGRRTGWASSRVSASALHELLHDPEVLFKRSEAKVFKQSLSALLVVLPVNLGETVTICGYKKVFRKNWLKRCTSLVRLQDRSRHSFELGHQFLDAGIPTPEPLWVIPPARWSWNDPAYLGFEWLPDCRDLNVQLASLTLEIVQTDPHVRKQVWSVTRELATVLGRMHKAGFCHRDLKFSNLLIDGVAEKPRVFIIDLDGATASTGNVDRWLWNLSRVARDALQTRLISRSTRCRFLRAYLTANPELSLTWKDVWRRLTVMVDKRNRRRRKAN
ncbi:3-deoxy-D-manno-octulosonic-acid kinase [Polystyrenella longa]|uniref:3-deoxy-D-manno-octulosonic-acid kinase n=1 Tax=Polystyrenella longa TaxID=2528007 RepID=A0A518CS12_9PLAN|nr:lipopolysaccharide kinase InaA family protein [Polystyrenella longa]QDU82000.1 3-deoxy-D-manno-octulosonic-acid kinase [Polystyrenella longa]